MRSLDIQALNFSYSNNDRKIEVLKDVNVRFPASSVSVLLGKSGCGKTTLLNIIAGLLNAGSGQVIYQHNNVVKQPRIGYVFQTPSLIPWRTVQENILLGIELRRMVTKKDVAKADALLEKYGLINFSGMYPSKLSGGMQQRVSIIRAVLSEADILLLDEPFSNVDIILKRELQLDLLNIVREEALIAILVTHDLIEAVKVAKQVVIFSRRPATVSKSLHIDLAINDRLKNNMLLSDKLLGYVRLVDNIMTNLLTYDQ